MMLPRDGMTSRPGPLLSLRILFCAVLVAVSAGIPAEKCAWLDCACLNRRPCARNSFHCGPCLPSFEENEEGWCVVKKRHAHSAAVEEAVDAADVAGTEREDDDNAVASASTPRQPSPSTSNQQHGSRKAAVEEAVDAADVAGTEREDDDNAVASASTPRQPSPSTSNQQHGSRKGNVTSLPELDEEIDYLAGVIAKQRETGVNQPVTPSQVSPKPKKNARKRKKSSKSTLAPPTTKAPPTALPKPPPDPVGREGPAVAPFPSRDIRLIMLVALGVLLGMVTLAIAAVCWVRVHKRKRLAQKVDYPALTGYGLATSSDGTSPGDKTLAQNAQMYHYQYQKQQMLSMEKHQDEPKVAVSEATSDEETEDGDFTVYECPGLAPTGEMEVKNPLFDDSTLQPQRNHK